MRKILKFVIFAYAISFLFSCQKEAPFEPGILVPKTVDDDPSLPALEINGTRLHLETFGNPTNPVIIFLHGGPGGDYRSLLRLKDNYDNYSLADEYLCVFYDQAGAGLSRRYGNLKKAANNEIPELKVEKYIADLHAIINHFSENQKVILFGHSWGGMLATEYINRYPEKVVGAVFSEPGAFTSELFSLSGSLNFFAEGFNDALWELQQISDDTERHESMDYAIVNSFLTMGPEESMHFDMENDPLKFFRYGAVSSSVNQFNDFDFTTNLNSFTTKVICINSSLNERLSVSFQQNENMLAYPNFEIKVIDNVGHDLMWKRADLHVKYMKEYFDEIFNN